MAGLGLKNFGSEVLTSNDVDGYLMQQTVMVFASSAARTSAFSAAGISPSEGMVSYLSDSNSTQVYDGANWQNIVTSEISTTWNSPTTLSLQTNGVTRASFDSSGRMLLSSQPRFFVARATNASLNADAVFTTVMINVGSHYSSVNGRFTAPVTGTYWFNVNSIGNTSGTSRLNIRINGSNYSPTGGPMQHRTANTANYGGTAAFPYLLNLNANDYTTLYSYDATTYSDTSGYFNWSGFLLG